MVGNVVSNIYLDRFGNASSITMNKLLLCLCIVNIFSVRAYNEEFQVHRIKRSTYPHRAVMFGGYYGRPMVNRQYVPEGAMTAFASGDSVTTGSFVREQWENEPSELDVPLSIQPEVIKTTEATIEDELEQTTIAKRIPKRKPIKPAEKEDEEDEEEEAWPFQIAGNKRNNVPLYNAFFPIMFGGYPGAKSRSDDGGYPGTATAIANSFSTGKGGSATSHATSYGDPYLNTMIRRALFNKKNWVQQDQ